MVYETTDRRRVRLTANCKFVNQPILRVRRRADRLIQPRVLVAQDDEIVTARAAAEELAEDLAAAAVAPAEAAANVELFTRMAGKRIKFLTTCSECGHEQSPSYPQCQRCQSDAPSNRRWTCDDKLRMQREINEQRREARNTGASIVPPTKEKRSITNFGNRWRKSYGHITHYKTDDDGNWVPKDTQTSKRVPNAAQYN